MPESEAPRVIEFLVPGDPDQNTGGYRYVRKLVQALNEQGQLARVTGLDGQFPRPDKKAFEELDQRLAALPEGTCVILDGLAMGGLPDVVAKHHGRLLLLALVHHPLADETGLSEPDRQWFLDSERRALAFVSGVVTTSRYTAARLADYNVPEALVRVAEPGLSVLAGKIKPTLAEDPLDAPHLLCVAHLSPRKAQHQLVAALAALKSLPWHCTLAGSDTRNPGYACQLRKQIAEAGLSDRVVLTGELDEDGLRDVYRRADLFVFPSLYEGYGMVIDEALAAGLPIISSDGGALANTAERPGVVQYSAGDVQALTARIEQWLTHPEELAHARKLAVRESRQVRSWQAAADDFLSAVEQFRYGESGWHQHSAFDSQWLSAREPADHRARSRELTAALNQWLADRYERQTGAQARPCRIVDIGTGRGSNVVYLAPALQVPQAWLAVDQDLALLREARERARGLDVPFETAPVQLTPENIEQMLPRETALVTASALIDLVSRPWLAALGRAVANRNAAVLIVLSYAGRFELSPEHPDDALLRDLVNRHQHGDKGTGAALGPDASDVLATLMAEAGYTVQTAESSWVLGGPARPGESSDTALIRMLMQGWVEAATEQSPESRPQLERWLSAREALLAGGALQIVVHHTDLLAVPPEPAV
ncbi:MAG: glycosyltransferase [Pseudomonadota bacterium]|uniref:glycosyltransferase n=1 Tax=Marinobacter sp. TaxID=50741 RepID=UPI002E87AADF|nr:glycosyltransferase [Pseudomonadota bacterium]